MFCDADAVADVTLSQAPADRGAMGCTTLPHSRTAILTPCHTAALPHYCTIAMLHYCASARFRYCTIALLHDCTTARLRYCTIAPLHCYRPLSTTPPDAGERFSAPRILSLARLVTALPTCGASGLCRRGPCRPCHCPCPCIQSDRAPGQARRGGVPRDGGPPQARAWVDAG